MPKKARGVSHNEMDAMKRLLLGDVFTNLLGLCYYTFTFVILFAFASTHGDGAVFMTSLMMAGCWNGLISSPTPMPRLIIPDIAGNKRVFRALPVSDDTWADAVWVQRVAIPLGILLVLSIPCLLVASRMGKLDTALWCRLLSSIALTGVFLCAGRQLMGMALQKKHSIPAKLLGGLFMVFAILADLSLMGYIPVSLSSSPVGASATVALGLLTFVSSFLTRRELCNDPVQKIEMVVAQKVCETPTGLPVKRLLNGCQPFLSFAAIFVFFNLVVSVLAFLIFLSPSLATMGIGENVRYVTGGLLAIAALTTVPNPAVTLRVMGALPLGRHRLAMFLSLSALVQACANLAVSTTVVLCGLVVLGRGQDVLRPEVLYFIPAYLGMAVIWYPLNLRVAEWAKRVLFAILVVVILVPFATFTAGVWALYAGLVFLPLGLYLGFRIAMRAMQHSDVYKQPAREMFARELPRS